MSLTANLPTQLSTSKCTNRHVLSMLVHWKLPKLIIIRTKYKGVLKNWCLSTRSLLKQNKLYVNMQSAYRIHHSTERAPLRVVNDIMRGIDDQQECVPMLLDLSSAFNTTDHDIRFIGCVAVMAFQGWCWIG